MNNKKQKEKKVYQKILKKSKYWPIVKLFSNRQKFMDEVSLISQEKLKKKLKEKSIIEEIKNTLYREKLRISRIQWKADPADDKIFWSNIEKEIEITSSPPVRRTRTLSVRNILEGIERRQEQQEEADIQRAIMASLRD